MNKHLLLLSLLACGTKPAPANIDTRHSGIQEDTNHIITPEETENNLDLSDIVYDPELFPKGCTNRAQNPDPLFRVIPIENRRQTCNFMGTDQRGDKFKLKDFLGDIIILQVGDMTCEECIHYGETDHIYHAIRHKYPEMGVSYISVITRNKDFQWASPSDIEHWYNDNNINNHPVLAVEPEIIGNADNQWMSSRNQRHFPMFYIIDKYSRLAWSSIPYERWDESFDNNHEWWVTIEQLLQEP